MAPGSLLDACPQATGLRASTNMTCTPLSSIRFASLAVTGVGFIAVLLHPDAYRREELPPDQTGTQASADVRAAASNSSRSSRSARELSGSGTQSSSQDASFLRYGLSQKGQRFFDTSDRDSGPRSRLDLPVAAVTPSPTFGSVTRCCSIGRKCGACSPDADLLCTRCGQNATGHGTDQCLVIRFDLIRIRARKLTHRIV